MYIYIYTGLPQQQHSTQWPLERENDARQLEFGVPGWYVHGCVSDDWLLRG